MVNELKLYDGKVYGEKVSDYGLENGYLDYQTLAKIVGDCVLNNNIFEYAGYENWELESGEEEDEEGNFYEVYQYYIVSYSGAMLLKHLTDEIVYYNNELDLYLWGVTHFGTAWSHVLTDIKLVEG